MPIYRNTALIIFLASAIALSTATVDQDTVGESAQQIDRSTKPGDDFYRYPNGGWLKNARISAELPSYDNRAILVARTSQRVRELIQEASHNAQSGVQQMVGDFYASFMDETAIEAKGMAPLADEMSAIAAITNRTTLSTYLGGTLNSEVDGLTSNSDHLFGVWVNQSFTDSGSYLFHLLQGGLGMPDREAYLDPSDRMAALRHQYEYHIAAMLRLAGVADSDEKAARVLALEVRIAQGHAPDSDAADVFKQNNPWKRSDFPTKAPGMDWDAYFKAAGVEDQSDFVVWQPTAIIASSALVSIEPVDVWKDYLKFHLIEHYASVLPKGVREEHFAFYGMTLSGARQASERSEDAIAATNAA